MDIKFPKIGGGEPGGASKTPAPERAANEKFADLVAQLGEQINPASRPATSPTQAALAPTRAALAQIAALYNLAVAEEASAAVRRSARLLITTRLPKKHLGKPQTEEMIEDLSEFVASDPLLKGKLLDILERIKA